MSPCLYPCCAELSFQESVHCHPRSPGQLRGGLLAHAVAVLSASGGYADRPHREGPCETIATLLLLLLLMYGCD